jgi:hypothetical protein
MKIKNHTLRRLRPGVTASELMVVLGLFGILTTGIFSLFSASIQQWSRGSGKSESDDVASIALQKAVRLIESGKSATVTSLPPAFLITPVLAVRLPGLNDQGDYERSVDGDTVYLYYAAGRLCSQVSGVQTVIAKGVQSFTYSISGGSVTLTLTVSRQSGMKTSLTTFTQRVALRNYTTPI